MVFNTDTPAFEADLKEVLRLFDPDLAGEYCVTHTTREEEGALVNSVSVNHRETVRRDAFFAVGALAEKRLRKRYAKLALYEALAAFFQREMPWGALTGIRPTRLYYQLREELGREDVSDFFTGTLRVSPKKAELVKRVVEEQAPLLNRDSRGADVYIGIPFCTSRCAYCSFLSSEIGAARELVAPYVTALIQEISAIKRLIEDAKLTVRAVYVGGGTPTALAAEQLFQVLRACAFGQREFTCEAGRPDTVTEDKLDAMARAGVTRISVNPQSFLDRTLTLIGRRHTAEDTERCYAAAKRYPFSVNMDLIAGLPEETPEDFRYSLSKAITLGPQAVTVHTLALKAGAKLKLQQYRAAEGVPEMVDGAYDALAAAGYRPYYLYRQKYMASNLENVGYALPGEACLYNVDIMEENTTILAAGANAITKRVFSGEARIERQANSKDVRTYLANLDALIEKKRNLFFCENSPN